MSYTPRALNRRFRNRVGLIAGVTGLVASLLSVMAPTGASAATGPGGGTYPVTGTKPGSIAAGPDGSMWFTEQAKDKIGRISRSGHVSTYSLTTAGAWPSSITAGPDGNMWFTEPGTPGKGDTYPNQIGRITPQGQVQEFPLSAGLGQRSPASVAAGSDGNLWVAEDESASSGGAGEIVQVSTAGTTLATYAVTGLPSDIAGGPDGNLWFTELGGNQIGRISTSGAVTYLALPSGALGLYITSGPDGNLWFTTEAIGNTYYIGSMTTGGSVTLYPIPAPTGGGSVPQPWGISTGSDGRVWAALFGTDQLVSVDTRPGVAGQMVVYDVPVSGEAAGPYAIASGPDGGVWFTDYLAGEVVDFPPSPVVSQFPAPNYTNGIDGVSAGPNADVWFSDLAGNQMDRVCQNGTLQRYSVPTAGGEPFGVSEGPYPHRISQYVVGIWFTEAGGNKIGVIPESAGAASQACGPLSVTEYTIPTVNSDPEGITSGPDGALWFTEFGANQIGRITDTGTITQYPIPTPNSEPREITTGPDGNLWFTEWGANQIGRITPAGVISEFPIPTAASEPFGITAGPDGNVWFTEYAKSQIGRITPSGFVQEMTTPTSSSEPAQIAAGPDGNLWYTEFSPGQIGRVSVAPSGVITDQEYPLNGARFPDAIAPTYSGLVFSDQDVDYPQPIDAIATIQPPGANAVVTPTGPAPANTTIPFGTSLTWTQLAPKAQTIVDSDLGLYASATEGNPVGSNFEYRFMAAGTYPYVAAAVGSTTPNGKVLVPIEVEPTQTPLNTPITVTWAAQAAPFGYAYDIKVKVPGGAYTTWIKGTTADRATYSSDGTAGEYTFQARLRNTSTGAFSGWSPYGAVVVTAS